jgi:MFS family permease
VSRIVVAAVAVVVAGVLPCFLTGSLAHQIRAEFAFGDAALGVAFATFHVVSALVAPFAGRLVRLIGPVGAMRASAGVACTCALGLALGARSGAALICLLAVGGLANATSGPAASAMLGGAGLAGRGGLAFGAQQAGAPLGALLAGLAVPLVGAPLGWRWAFAGAALVALAAALSAPRGSELRAAARRPQGHRGFRSVHILALGAACASATSTGLVAFLIVFAVHSGMSEAAAAITLAGVSVAAATGRIGLGLTVDRRDWDPLAVVGPVLVLGAAGPLLLMTAAPVLIVPGALVTAGLGWAWPGLFTLAVVNRHPQAPAQAVGIVMSGLFAGAVAGPLIVGGLASAASYQAAWSACSALTLLSAATVAFARALDSSADRRRDDVVAAGWFRWRRRAVR